VSGLGMAAVGGGVSGCGSGRRRCEEAVVRAQLTGQQVGGWRRRRRCVVDIVRVVVMVSRRRPRRCQGGI